MKLSNALQSVLSNTFRNNPKGDSNSGPTRTPVESGAHRNRSDKITISEYNADNQPSTLTYSGHGTLEIYPENLSISYVVGHELRHVQQNRMSALAKGENVQQTVKYNISLRDGKLIAKGGVTEATFTSKRKTEHPVDLIDKKKIKISLLEKEKGELEERLKNLDRRKENSEIANSMTTTSKRVALKQKIELIEENISGLKHSHTMNGMVKESSGPDDVIPEVAKIPEKDNITLRNISDIVTQSFQFVKNGVPNVVLQNSAASAITVNNALDSLHELDRIHPIERDVTFDPQFIKQKVDIWGNFREKLADLSFSSRILQFSGSFNIHVPSSSGKDKLTALTTIDTQDGTYEVSISRIALPHRVVSDIHSDPFQSLNLSGTIKINGFDISIETTDSLFDIKNKINRGEDINDNGTLDLTEDLNGNGVLDIFILGEGENRTVVFEDIDLDRVIDPSEDVNGNERIDGGSSQVKVEATIQNNQLILTSLRPQKIELIDNNDALISLGILMKDVRNNVMLKHYVATSQTSIILNREPRNANLNVDGIEYERDSNTISNIVPNVTLQVKAPSNKNIQLSIQPDVTQSFNFIKNFMESFNEVIKTINDQLAFKRTMKNDPVVQRIRTNLIKNTTDAVESSQEDINSISKAGLKSKNTGKNAIQEISITNILKKLKKGITSVVSMPSKGSNSLFSHLGNLGIRTNIDDTLVIDKERLTKVLKKHPKEIFYLFSNTTDGIVPRLQKQLNKMLNAKVGVGTITTQQFVLQSFLKDASVLEKIRKNINKVQSSFYSKTISTKVIA